MNWNKIKSVINLKIIFNILILKMYTNIIYQKQKNIITNNKNNTKIYEFLVHTYY